MSCSESKRLGDGVSVIMAVRNGDRYLAEAIDSVLNSTLPPLEIIVIDGHSDDRTAQIAKSFSAVMIQRELLHRASICDIGETMLKLVKCFKPFFCRQMVSPN